MSTPEGIETDVIGRIKAVMAAEKKSAAELSRVSGLPYPSLQNYLLGKHRIPSGALGKIAKALNVSTHWLLFGNTALDQAIVEDCLEIVGDIKAFSGGKVGTPEAAAVFRGQYEKHYSDRFLPSPRDKATLESELTAVQTRSRKRLKPRPR